MENFFKYVFGTLHWAPITYFWIHFAYTRNKCILTYFRLSKSSYLPHDVQQIPNIFSYRVSHLFSDIDFLLIVVDTYTKKWIKYGVLAVDSMQ